jgi:hypothetical protein
MDVAGIGERVVAARRGRGFLVIECHAGGVDREGDRFRAVAGPAVAGDAGRRGLRFGFRGDLGLRLAAVARLLADRRGDAAGERIRTGGDQAAARDAVVAAFCTGNISDR